MSHSIQNQFPLIAVLLLLAFTTNASAGVDYNFSYSGPGVTASGVFTTADPFYCLTLPGQACSQSVIDLTGMRNSQPMTLLGSSTFCPPNSAQCNDNHLYLFNFGSYYLFRPDGFGLGFAAGGTNYLLVAGSIDECTVGSCIGLTTFTVAPAAGGVPEPRSLMLVGTGLLFVFRLARRRNAA